MIEILEENREILSRYRLKGFSYLGGLLVETGNAIELKGVTKRFGDVIANDNVNLTVRKGEILSILGENGSGKTTLMNMLSGIYFPDEGERSDHPLPKRFLRTRYWNDSSAFQADQYFDSRREYYFRSAWKRKTEYETGRERNQGTDRTVWI